MEEEYLQRTNDLQSPGALGLLKQVLASYHDQFEFEEFFHAFDFFEEIDPPRKPKIKDCYVSLLEVILIRSGLIIFPKLRLLVN